ncbi:uncharacterized protein LOC103514327 [Diaphorina citri]|uniref:Uncharacterized protein LOC103514327 n=1 Tax=Diaphorina citri TaxID=121845 RepID=A0A1S3DB91_DIACI|nr:uncharacterized protein LOC103514327 [Diaphorina citri]
MKMLFAKSLVAAILLILSGLAAEPTLEDNQLPTDEDDEEDFHWHRGGQPELEFSSGLPTDEQSFNALNAFYSGGGNQHFVSSSFPEIDARGFHGSVFDNFDSVYPAPRRASYGKHKPFLKDKYAYLKEELWIPPKFRQEKILDEVLKRSTQTSRMEKKQSEKSSKNHQHFPEKVKVSSMDLLNKSNHVLDNINSVKRADSEYCCDNIYSRPYIYDLHDKKASEMTSKGFHSDIFNRRFGDFHPMEKKGSKRAPDMTAMGFHGDTFNRGFGHFDTMDKRAPDMTAMGFHGDTFNRGFGHFDPMDKRAPDMNARGFHGDTFSRGFGNFDTMDKRAPDMTAMGFHGDTFNRGFGHFDPMDKRAPDMNARGFHGDTFSRGFGNFDTMDKRVPDMNAMGFHGDTFNRGFGHFDPMDKRAPDMNARGFHGDTFSRGFGNFDTMDKRAPDMNAMGFHGDTFNRGFGHFDPMDKRAPDMNARGFHGDTFSRGFGNFDTMDKRNSEFFSFGLPILRDDSAGRNLLKHDLADRKVSDMNSRGFHGDTFSRDFGRFGTMDKRTVHPRSKLLIIKRGPDMTSTDWHGDTFHADFGGFHTMK